MYLQKGSQHHSKEQSSTLVCHQSNSTVQALEWGAPVTEDSVITSNNCENINNQAKDMQVKPTADKKNGFKVIFTFHFGTVITAVTTV